MNCEIWNRIRDGDRHALGVPRARLNRGFSMVEMIVYLAILSVMLVSVVGTLRAMTRSYGSLRTAMNVERSAVGILERMLREVRDAKSIDAASVLGSSPGKLILHSTDAAGAEKTVEFSLSGGSVELKENGVSEGGLNASNVPATNLVFRSFDTGRSKGIKVELTLESGAAETARRAQFWGSAVLRDSY